jgi:FkbM family methyltransferase
MKGRMFYRLKIFLKSLKLGKKYDFIFLRILQLLEFFYENRINPTRYVKKEFLRESGSVMHIGAHYGQERYFYDQLGLRVLWIEGDPEIYEVLSHNIAKFELQSSKCALLGDKNVDHIDFNLTNNNGMSSSIYTLNSEGDFAGLHITGTKNLPLARLSDILVNTTETYSYWVLDVQGAELQVLKGSGIYLDQCKFLELEISTWEVYLGQPLFKEIEEWLMGQGFFAIWKPCENFHSNILFIRRY